MDYSIEQHRDYIAPMIYQCISKLYEKIKENNDMITYHIWKDLVSLLAYNNTTVSFSFNMFLQKNKEMPNHEEYKTIIIAMLALYERNG